MRSTVRAASGATGGAPALHVEGLGKRFGDRVAFDDVSFEVGYGEVFGFLGPNGARKTTTVRTLGTLIAPTSGSATVAGFALVPENGVEIRRRISIMPESPGLYLRLSVAENLECFAVEGGCGDPPAAADEGQESGAECDAHAQGRGDQVERDERGYRDRGQADEQGELGCGAGVAGAG
ncbi:MAG: ATP-binding cassette domain-containing protein, partial [Actinomycetota bacterium]|nr:ATP-binding cassette domain-containing protein [Actinomycetota bacterium]